ncbi:MAG: hypothetical protein R2865_10475 [Deinococcales bacterium]
MFDGRTALEWLIEGAGVHHLGKLELDLAWMVRGNRNPVTLLDRYKGQISHIHVKDIDIKAMTKAVGQMLTAAFYWRNHL